MGVGDLSFEKKRGFVTPTLRGPWKKRSSMYHVALFYDFRVEKLNEKRCLRLQHLWKIPRSVCRSRTNRLLHWLGYNFIGPARCWRYQTKKKKKNVCLFYFYKLIWRFFIAVAILNIASHLIFDFILIFQLKNHRTTSTAGLSWRK